MKNKNIVQINKLNPIILISSNVILVLFLGVVDYITGIEFSFLSRAILTGH
jgi:hypothetical protein